jgi:hypothetical protein
VCCDEGESEGDRAPVARDFILDTTRAGNTEANVRQRNGSTPEGSVR